MTAAQILAGILWAAATVPATGNQAKLGHERMAGPIADRQVVYRLWLRAVESPGWRRVLDHYGGR